MAELIKYSTLAPSAQLVPLDFYQILWNTQKFTSKSVSYLECLAVPQFFWLFAEQSLPSWRILGVRFESWVFAVWCGVNWHNVGYFLTGCVWSLRRPQDLLLFQSTRGKLSSAQDVSLHAAVCDHLSTLQHPYHWNNCWVFSLGVLPTHRWKVLGFFLRMMHLIIMDSGIGCMLYVIGWFLSARAVFTTW